MQITTTQRLIIREAKEYDASFILVLLNSPNWIRFIGDRNIKNKKDARSYIKNVLIQSYQDHGYGLFIMTLKADHVPIGICGFVKRDYLSHPDIGFAILPEFEGMGYTLEAAKAMLVYGQNKLKMYTIYAITDCGNIKSRSLLKKIGLKENGMIMPKGNEELLLLYKLEYCV